MAHNYYRLGGGEDAVFQAEAKLLEAYGHRVLRFVCDNADLDERRSFALAGRAFWNRKAAAELRALLQATGASLVHFHNTFPLMSPSVYYAARRENVAVVQTLHNFRLSCIQGFFFRDGKVCNDCLRSKFPYPSVIHRCYRGSLPASAVAAAMIRGHHLAGTWRNLPNRYIALTEFGRARMIEAGLPAERVVVKPNFVEPDPGLGTGAGGYAIYVGRLSPEKGLNVLLAAWTQYYPGIPLKIVGDGPMVDGVRQMVAGIDHVTMLGRKAPEATMELVRDAMMAIVPSQGVESCPLTVIEALACGTPVIASRILPLSTLVSHDRTGYLFSANDPVDLSRQVRRAQQNQDMLRSEARAEYLGRYTAAINYRQLINIYQDAIAAAGPRGRNFCKGVHSGV